MFSPRATSQFRKDLKRRLGDLELLLKVTRVMSLIAAGEPLPPDLKQHKLEGGYRDCCECHIRPDVLLIWLPDSRARVVTFMRIGSHAELFG
ncbi:MAG: type II toxin-antitoxin system YafQ family toxin [Gemmatimonadetes bacterium]|nr:type II toxin-antitoxin system YafQ family toxin [Gemmatimonadota bacterium]